MTFQTINKILHDSLNNGSSQLQNEHHVASTSDAKLTPSTHINSSPDTLIQGHNVSGVDDIFNTCRRCLNQPKKKLINGFCFTCAEELQNYQEFNNYYSALEIIEIYKKNNQLNQNNSNNQTDNEINQKTNKAIQDLYPSHFE